ncbi:MAG: bifunctional 23S rRNA (guanine(2069)-N(7))-methyltransferase RlmK/23S rRNA (guanine(2445)-N(2))-methyltransferase RlmL [Pseudomonadota bacterium]
MSTPADPSPGAQRFTLTCARHLPSLLLQEVEAFGFEEVQERAGAVIATGSLEAAYRACLWSRTAGRVLMEIASGAAGDGDALYATAREIDWSAHLRPEQTLSVVATLQRARIRHSHFAAQRVKDAIVDQWRERSGERPSVQPTRPDVPVHVLVRGEQAVISLDLSGEPLHRRGYRMEQGVAPLRETLAAALLLRSGWPQIAADGGAFIDPMCGAGTLLIEAAWIAGDVAPGLPARRYWGFDGWLGHDRECWERLLGEARARASAAADRLVPGRIRGFDADGKVLRIAQGNLVRAGLGDHVPLSRREIADEQALSDLPSKGLVLANPPYGERLGEQRELAGLYASLGQHLRRHYGEGWVGAVFTGNPPLGRELGLRATRTHRFMNGPIDCRLLQFDLGQVGDAGPAREEGPRELSAGGQELANRLRKNLRNLARWRRREEVTCYRLYDGDLPEYRFAIDLYETVQGQVHAHVQEYAAPAKIDQARARERVNDALGAVGEVLSLAPPQVHLKRRQRQRGATQYRRQAERDERLEVVEHGYRLEVNLDDYLDTGLFLDHRPLRRWVKEQADQADFLNLFAYTGAVTVAAAMGGARSTTSVDLSNTYLDWAERNLGLNVPEGPWSKAAHRFIRADVMGWLAPGVEGPQDRYDLIFVDPPSFSTSKRVEGTFDVQRDHVELLRRALALLRQGGTLLFSNNLRGFKFDQAAVAAALGPQHEVVIDDLTRESIPTDFARNPRIHHCWRLRRA